MSNMVSGADANLSELLHDLVILLIPSAPAVLNCCCSKGSAPYWITGLTHCF